MELLEQKIPEEFIRNIPRGFRLARKQGLDYLMVESLFCPNGHNLVVDSVRIHDEASIKLKIIVGNESGFVFLDAFWGSHAKLFSFIPQGAGREPLFVEPHCPYCDVSMSECFACNQEGCGSTKSVMLKLPGNNVIHLCARLGCPGHVLEIHDMPDNLVQSVSGINYFGAGPGAPFDGV
jgi:hypothetical protein